MAVLDERLRKYKNGSPVEFYRVEPQPIRYLGQKLSIARICRTGIIRRKEGEYVEVFIPKTGAIYRFHMSNLREDEEK